MAISGGRGLPPPRKDPLGPITPSLLEANGGYGLIGPTFEDDEKESPTYFEATYIGRLIPVGVRRLLCEHYIWNAGRRLTFVSIRSNNAAGPSRCAFA